MQKNNNYNETEPTNAITQESNHDIEIQKKKYIDNLYKDWFLDYASYVILERAIPALEDGLKPVQRRILHAMKKIDDSRFHKVANIIGQTMQYHPHGDAAIGSAIVNLGQKNLLITTQGNWGDSRTGDSAAAARYIEAKLSKFALEVAFNYAISKSQLSYDGRNHEPTLLPVKFPLILAQGAEGIAVGLATKIMPHNFIELIDASIEILQGNEVEIYPDFHSGGEADFSNYNQGKKGGKIRVRSKIEAINNKTLVITEIPFSTTTTSVIDSIVKANDNGKIKIKKIIDNTARDIEIMIELHSGVSPDQTIGALYAFTDCEVSISPNCCLIVEDRPKFLSVNEVLKLSTRRTVDLLKQELQIILGDLQRRRHLLIMESLFISRKIYLCMEECESWEAILATIENKFEPFKKELPHPISNDDIIKLTEIKIRRISKFNANKTAGEICDLEKQITQVKYNLEHLTEFAISYFSDLKKKYGAGHERKTIIKEFDTIQATQVAAANHKLYVNRKDGFIGYSLKKDELVGECSDIDDIIIFFKNGSFKVVRISNKAFVGKNILHVTVWNKNDKRMTYNMIYSDSESGLSRCKRFPVTAITRDREYDLTGGSKNAKVLYFTANSNGETEVVTVHLRNQCRAKNKVFDFDFATLSIKGRNARGNILTKYPVTRVAQKDVGKWSFDKIDIWYDSAIGRLNQDGHGENLGKFGSDDLILVIDKRGWYQLTGIEMSNLYDNENLSIIEKFSPETVITAVHYDGAKGHHFVKRFKIETQSLGQRFRFITDHENSRLLFVSTEPEPCILLTYQKKRPLRDVQEVIELDKKIDVKGWKANGNRLCFFEVLSITQYNKTEQEKTVREGDTGNTEQKDDRLEEKETSPERNKTDSEVDVKDILPEQTKPDSKVDEKKISQEQTKPDSEADVKKMQIEALKKETAELKAEVKAYVQDSFFDF